MGVRFSACICLDDKMEHRAMMAEARASEMQEMLLRANLRADVAERDAAEVRRELEATTCKLAAVEATLASTGRTGEATTSLPQDAPLWTRATALPAAENEILLRLAAVKQAVKQPSKSVSSSKHVDSDAVIAALTAAEEKVMEQKVEKQDDHVNSNHEGDVDMTSPTAAAFRTRTKLHRTPTLPPKTSRDGCEVRGPLAEYNRAAVV